MANYPTSASTNANLYVAVNNKNTNLTSAIDAVVTTIPVTSTTGFPTSGFISIDLEIIAYTGVTATDFTGATRGADGTSAATHALNSLVSHNIVAAHHNVNKNEIIAVEADLVNSLGTITPVTPAVTAANIFERLGQIVTQLKAITGTTNWYDSVAVNLLNKLSLVGGTLTGALNVIYSVSGNNTSIALQNTSNTASSDAFIQVSAGGTSGGDAASVYSIPSGGSTWAAGVDNSDSDAYKISQNAGLGTNDYFKIALGGLITIANKITGLTNGSAASDAAAFGQIKYLAAPVQATTETQTSTTSTSFVSTTLSASITPTSASSRIKITMSGDMQQVAIDNPRLSIFRGSTDLGGASNAGFLSLTGPTGTDGGTYRRSVAVVYIDSPATTSSTTYEVRIRSGNGSSTSFPSGNVPKCVIVLEEVV